MSTAQITLDLDFAPYLSRRIGMDENGDEISEPMTMEDVVLDAAVKQFMRGIDSEVRNGISHRIAQIRDEVIREQIAPIITEALTGAITQTNSYGEPIQGSTTTLREIIAKQATIETKIQPFDQRTSRYGNPTTATKVLVEQVQKVVTKELSAVVAAVKAETYEAVKAAASEAIAKAVQS